jgi:Ca2+-transporting ATPase
MHVVGGHRRAQRGDRLCAGLARRPAMAALQRLAAPHATVLRDGQVQVLPAERAGARRHRAAGGRQPGAGRPAPARVAQLQVDESALTGESVTVDKHTRQRSPTGPHALGDRLNMAFKGTTGHAWPRRRPGGGHRHGHRTRPVAGCSRARRPQHAAAEAPGGVRQAAGLAVLGICAVIFAAGVLRGEAPLLMILTAISLAVAAIPEALPAVVTVLLALGARAWWRNALVRRCRRWRRWARSPPSARTRPAR